jgi:hypothetical protein
VWALADDDAGEEAIDEEVSTFLDVGAPLGEQPVQRASVRGRGVVDHHRREHRMREHDPLRAVDEHAGRLGFLDCRRAGGAEQLDDTGTRRSKRQRHDQRGAPGAGRQLLETGGEQLPQRRWHRQRIAERTSHRAVTEHARDLEGEVRIPPGRLRQPDERRPGGDEAETLGDDVMQRRE